MPELATRSEMVEKMKNIISGEVQRVIAASRSRKIIIYGAGARGIVLFELLKSSGYEVPYFIDAGKKGTTVCGIPVYEPMHIMYEDFDTIFVAVAADFPGELIENLKNFGLDPESNATCIFDRKSLDDGTAYVTPYPTVDFFLGHTRIYELPGFKYLGDGDARNIDVRNGLRILTLGGSTTDPEVVDPIDLNGSGNLANCAGSWPRFLHELLTDQGIRNSIYNGGMGGYTAAQEAIKLVRDGLAIKPDIVITLDGINDGCWIYWLKNKYPKFHAYFEHLERAVSPILADNKMASVYSPVAGFVNGISYGIESSETSAFEEWHANHRLMHAVCNEFDVEYVAFLQPGGLHDVDYLDSCDVQYRAHWFTCKFFTTTGRQLHDLAGDQYSKLHNGIEVTELLSQFHSNIFDYDVDAVANFNIRYKNIEEFYKKAKQVAEKSDYILDIVDTFNGIPDVFMDTAHCTSEGNALLARRIYDEMNKSGVLSKALAKVAARNQP